MRKVLQDKNVLFCRMAKRTVFIATLATISLLTAETAQAALPLNVVNSLKVKDEVTVTGTVYDEKGGPLPGVSVTVKGTTTVAVSNSDGKYSIKVPNENAILVFSYVGYNSQEVPTKGKSTVNTQLTANSQSLNELVVVGYGTQKKSTLAGSVSVVKGGDLVKSPQPNLSNSLAGRVSGVVINNRGGEPGYDGSRILIRGLGTTTNSDVLVVVDGIPGQLGGLERIDPNDVESISVLKDASAAVYGNRAANGVILITTKKGKIGKPTVSYTFNQGFSMPTRLPKMADAATYAQIMNEINFDSNPNGGLNQAYSAAQIQKFRDGSDPDNYPNVKTPPIGQNGPAFAGDYSKIQQSNRSKEVIFAAQFSSNLALAGGTGELDNTTHLYYPTQYDAGMPGMIRDFFNGRPFRRLRPTDYTMNIFDKVNDSRFFKTFQTVYYRNVAVTAAETFAKWTAANAPNPSLVGKPRVMPGDTAALFIVNPDTSSLLTSTIAAMRYYA
ncbi:MAG: RagB/SusD family nutrient uptake outer membrane protein, partial [Pedobacter sp.]